MSRLNDLIRQVGLKDEALAADLQREVAALADRRWFGLTSSATCPRWSSGAVALRRHVARWSVTSTCGQIAKANSSNVAGSRRVIGSSAANS